MFKLYLEALFFMNKKFLSVVLSASMVLSPMCERSCFADAVIRQNREENHINCTESPVDCEYMIETYERELRSNRKQHWFAIFGFTFSLVCFIALKSFGDEVIRVKDEAIRVKDEAVKLRDESLLLRNMAIWYLKETVRFKSEAMRDRDEG